MDLLKELGELALGSRMRRIIDRFTQDVDAIYAHNNVDFKPRWFGLFYFLGNHGPKAIGDAAKGLNISHPAVNQLAQEMIKDGLITPVSDCRDKRKRMLTLTPRGEQLFSDLVPLWDDMAAVMCQFVCSTHYDLLDVFNRIDASLDEVSLYDRYLERIRRRNQQQVEIVTYRPEYACHFKRINEAWISQDYTLEAADEVVLNHPEETIIQKGGQVFFALLGNQPVGTCALIHHGTTQEMAKFAVDLEFRGKHIGTKLLEHVIEWCRENGVQRITLETNHRQRAAINLYRKYGFRMIPPDHPSEFNRADTWMALDLVPSVDTDIVSTIKELAPL